MNYRETKKQEIYEIGNYELKFGVHATKTAPDETTTAFFSFVFGWWQPFKPWVHIELDEWFVCIGWFPEAPEVE